MQLCWEGGIHHFLAECGGAVGLCRPPVMVTGRRKWVMATLRLAAGSVAPGLGFPVARALAFPPGTRMLGTAPVSGSAASAPCSEATAPSWCGGVAGAVPGRGGWRAPSTGAQDIAQVAVGGASTLFPEEAYDLPKIAPGKVRPAGAPRT